MYQLLSRSAVTVMVAALFACASSEMQGERLQHVSVVDTSNWKEINLRLKESPRFLRGDSIVSTESGSGFSVLYPAANNAMFAGAILGHALVGTALLEAEQTGQIKTADEVLEGSEQAFDGVNGEAASRRLAAALENEMGITAHSISDEKPNIPTMITEPFFALAQSKDHVVVENMVSISEGDTIAYTNRVRLISRQFDLQSLNALEDEASLADRLLHLYTITSVVALEDAANRLQPPEDEPTTWRITIGKDMNYHRATLLGSRDGFTLLRKLGGNLLLAPEEAVSQG